MITRRHTLTGAAAFALSACAPAAPSAPPWTAPDSVKQQLDGIETRVGGRLGLSALDSGTGRRIDRRAHEPFAMCSTFKWLLAAAVLKSAQYGGLRLSDRVHYTRADLLEYAPVTTAHVGEGAMSIEDLCAAAVEQSDNTAANLLLPRVNGPGGLTNFIRASGDAYTRLDRHEPELNENAPGDPRDTTTTDDMLGSMQRILNGDVLRAALREKLIGWMVVSETGKARLRGGMPAAWRVGDKTGTGGRGSVNDVAIAFPPPANGRPRAPILIACYMSETTASVTNCNAAQAEIGHLIAETFA